MKWEEFADLLSGLSAETPLGRMVTIRSETNPDIIKNFTPDQKRIRAEWAKRSASYVTQDQMAAMLEQVKRALIANAKNIKHKEEEKEAEHGDTEPPA